MTTTDTELLELAQTVCTEKELAALRLSIRGMSERAISLALDISRSAVRSRVENAHRKIEIARRKDTPA